MEFLKSVLDGIIIAAATAIFIFIFRRYIHPFLLGVLQKTPDVSGIWEGYDADENWFKSPNSNSRMEIKQLGANISATVHRKSADEPEQVYKYNGTMSHGQILFIWKRQDSNGYYMGTMNLHLIGKLNELHARTTFVHRTRGKIVSQNKIYKKVSK